MPDETETPSTNIAIGVVYNYRLGPSKELNLSTHFLRDEPDEKINAGLDRIRRLGNRQEAIEELPIFKRKLDSEKRRLAEIEAMIVCLNEDYPSKVEALRAEYKERITGFLNSRQDDFIKRGRRGTFEPGPQDQSRMNQLESELDQKLAQLKFDTDGNISTNNVTAIKTRELIAELELSILDRETLIGG